MVDAPHDDDVPVTDRRRFTPEGELRPDAAAEVDAASAVEARAEAQPALAAELEEWRRRAQDAEARLAELAESYRRARDDLNAARARLERDQESRVKDAVGRAFERILATVDSLDRALSHADEGPLADGLQLVQRQLLDALAAEGVERIEVLGRPFDPSVAEAVVTSPAETPAEAGAVLEEVRAGYRLGERILRPAQVRVAV